MDSPEFLGPYRIGEVLGRGGMGTVFSGMHEKTKQPVAVKLIASHVADEMRFRRRFDAEIETLKRLRHPGIVQLIGYGEQSGQLFYSMELVQGETLQRRIRREKRLEWLPTIDIAIQICAALKHAHDFGVIHRDLKPANLIMTEGEQVKLVDFGVAKIFGSGEHTAVGSVMGTADYMAPEQADGSGVTVRTDLYALGSVMYAMLTGRPPFTGKKITEVIDSLRRKKPVPLEMVIPDLPDDVVALVHQLLSKSPDDRPPTALAVMNRLKAMRAGLQHQQTLLEREARNREESPELGLSDRGTDVVDDSLTSVSSIDAGNTHHPTDQHGRDTRPSTQSGPEESKPDDKPKRVSRGEDVTLVSEKTATSRMDDDVELERPEPKTHFQTVDDSKAVVAKDESDPSGTFSHGLSIGILIAVLLFGIIFIAKTIQKPSPETIFEQIAHQESIGQLSAARSDIDRFLKLFPDDERIDQVRDYDATLRLSGLVRRLYLKKKLAINPLDAHEQGFLEAIRLSENDPLSAKKKLNQWLSVFGSAAMHAEDDRAEMAELARFQLKQLAKVESKSDIDLRIQDPRVRDLVERIRAGEHLPPDERLDLLNGILSLYKEENWAKPALEIARKHVESVELEVVKKAMEAEAENNAKSNDEAALDATGSDDEAVDSDGNQETP